MNSKPSTRKFVTGKSKRTAVAASGRSPTRRVHRHPDQMYDDELQRYEGMMTEEQAEKIELTTEEEAMVEKLLREDRARLRKENVVLAARAREILKTLPVNPSGDEPESDEPDEDDEDEEPEDDEFDDDEDPDEADDSDVGE